MENQKDDAAQQLRLTLTDYVIELVNETPILSRYTDVIPRPDGLGGWPEIERDRAWRNSMKRPNNATTLNACITALAKFRDAPTLWDSLRGELLKSGHDWIVKELAYRRKRRNTNIENLLLEARKLAPEMPTVYEILSAMSAPDEDKKAEPKYDIAAVMQGVKDGTLEPPPTLPTETNNRRTGVLDFRGWEYAATKFDNDTTADVEYIQKEIVNQLVAAYADYNDKLLQAGGKPFLKAEAQLTFPPDVSQKGAKAILEMLNNQVGIIPPAKFKQMSVLKIIEAFERRYQELADVRNICEANGAKLDALNAKTDEVLDEMGLWRKWLECLKREGPHRNTPKIARVLQEAVENAWDAYCKECRNKHKRPTQKDFMDNHATDEIYKRKIDCKSYMLIDIVKDESEVKAIIHNRNEKRRQIRQKIPTKKVVKAKPKQKRKYK